MKNKHRHDDNFRDNIKEQIILFHGLYRRATKEGIRSFSTFANALKNEHSWEESDSYTSEYDLWAAFDKLNYC